MTVVARGLGRSPRGILVTFGLGRSAIVSVPHLPGWPRVTDVATTRLKISGRTIARVSFSFDQPVEEWVVMVGGTGPFDGMVVASRKQNGLISGTADVARRHTKHGLNQIKVYGRVGSHWSP